MILEIECLWHTDKTRELDAGMDFDMDDLERREVTFYNIDAIAPSGDFCYIYATGDKFTSAYTYEETRQMIEKAKQLTLSHEYSNRG